MVALSSLVGGGGGGSPVVCNHYGAPLPQYIKCYEYKSTTNSVLGTARFSAQVCGGGILSLSDNTFMATVNTGGGCEGRFCSRVFEIDNTTGCLTAKTDWTILHDGGADFGGEEYVQFVSDNCCNIYMGPICCGGSPGNSKICIKRFNGSSITNVTTFAACCTYQCCSTYPTYVGVPGWVHSYHTGNCNQTIGMIYCNASLYLLAQECGEFAGSPMPVPISHNQLYFYTYSRPSDSNQNNNVVVRSYRRGSSATSTCNDLGHIALYQNDLCHWVCLNDGQCCGFFPLANDARNALNIGKPTAYYYMSGGECLADYNNNCCFSTCRARNVKVAISGNCTRWCFRQKKGQIFTSGCNGGGNKFNYDIIYTTLPINSPMQHNHVRSRAFSINQGTSFGGSNPCVRFCQGNYGAPWVEDHTQLESQPLPPIYSYGHSPQVCITTGDQSYQGTAIVGCSWRVGLFVNNDSSCLCANIVVEKIHA